MLRGKSVFNSRSIVSIDTVPAIEFSKAQTATSEVSAITLCITSGTVGYVISSATSEYRRAAASVYVPAGPRWDIFISIASIERVSRVIGNTLHI